MSGHSQPLSQRNVSVRVGRSGMSYNSPRGGGLAPGLTAFEEDVESLLPLETEASTSSRETNSRDVLLRENLSLQKLSSSSQKDRLRTTVLLNLASVMERMDEQILPAVYIEIGKAFTATPTQLGYLTLSRAIVQAFSSPFGGIAGHYYDRIIVTAIGCFIWGTMTMGFAFCTSIKQGMLFWAVNGVGLSLVIPNSQSCIADLYSSTSRGLAFGTLYVTSGIGAMLGSLFATNIGNVQVGSMPGWRFAFVAVAFLSLLIGGLTLWLGQEPRKLRGAAAGSAIAPKEGGIKLADIAGHMINVMRVPTFGLIVAQGIVGSIPWSALVYLTLYFQLLGMTDFAASMLMALLLGSTAVGGLLGGWVGDKAASRYPDHGRILVCQFSVAVGIPFSLTITKILPHNGDSHTVAMYAVTMVVCGLLKSWAAPAFNNCAFAEIVPSHLRTLVYSFDRCFEGAIAACAAPLVGLLAEKIFGFKGTATRTGDPVLDLAKANAMGNALLCFMIVPWSLCLLAYCGVHFTYPADRTAALKESVKHMAESLPTAGSPAERQRLRSVSDLSNAN